MKIAYKQIPAPESLKKKQWILKSCGFLVVLILLSVVAFIFMSRAKRCRAKVNGHYLECGSNRLFLCGTELRERLLVLETLAKNLGDTEIARPYPQPPTSVELMKFIDHSSFTFELKCQQLANAEGNLLNWDLEIPFDPSLELNPLQFVGLRTMLDIAQKYNIFVVLSLTSSVSMSEFAQDGLAYHDIDRYILNIIVPIVRALMEHPSLLAISPLDRADDLLEYVDLDDVCTDLSVLDNAAEPRKWQDGLTIRMIQYYVAKVAEAVHTVDPEELVTVISSNLASVKPVGHPGFFSDACLAKACLGCDFLKANVDFYMPASFGIGSGNSMPSVPFMSSIDKPIVLAFDPAEELELARADVETLPKTLKDIGFSGFFLPVHTRMSLADDIRINEAAKEAGLENVEYVEILEEGQNSIPEVEKEDFQEEFDTIIQEIQAEDGRRIIIEAEPRDDVYGADQPIFTGLSEDGEEQEEHVDDTEDPLVHLESSGDDEQWIGKYEGEIEAEVSVKKDLDEEAEETAAEPELAAINEEADRDVEEDKKQLKIADHDFAEENVRKESGKDEQHIDNYEDDFVVESMEGVENQEIDEDQQVQLKDSKEEGGGTEEMDTVHNQDKDLSVASNPCGKYSKMKLVGLRMNEPVFECVKIEKM